MLKLSSTIFILHGWFLPEFTSIMMLNANFLVLPFLLHLLIAFLLKEELSIFFIYLYQCGLLYSYFIQSVTIFYYFCLFWCSNCPRLTSGKTRCHLYLFGMFSSSSEHFLNFWHKISHIYPVSTPSPPVLDLTISPRSPGSIEWNGI